MSTVKNSVALQMKAWTQRCILAAYEPIGLLFLSPVTKQTGILAQASVLRALDQVSKDTLALAFIQSISQLFNFDLAGKLKAIEYEGMEPRDGDACCPVCGEYKDEGLRTNPENGHSETCWLAFILKGTASHESPQS